MDDRTFSCPPTAIEGLEPARGFPGNIDPSIEAFLVNPAALDDGTFSVPPAAIEGLKTSRGFLGPVAPAVESFMRDKLHQAHARIKRYGLTLDLTDPADLMLLVAVADYLYAKRDTGAGLPQMLKDEIHDRQVAKSTGGST